MEDFMKWLGAIGLTIVVFTGAFMCNRQNRQSDLEQMKAGFTHRCLKTDCHSNCVWQWVRE